jgi:hypothetical protein
MAQNLTKRDRYARRPDKVWRSRFLKHMLYTHKKIDLFDSYGVAWYNRNIVTTMEPKDDNDTQPRP